MRTIGLLNNARTWAAWALALACHGGLALAQSSFQATQRESVVFEVSRTTTVGQSVFVLGDLAELGGNDMTRAVKLEPSAYPLWRATISLPKGRTYTFRYAVRNDAPGQTSQASNGTFFTGPTTASTGAASNSALRSRAVLLTWDLSNPQIWWRQGNGAFVAARMDLLGPGRTRTVGNTTVTERIWVASGLGRASSLDDRPIEFYFTDASGGSRYPASGSYRSGLDVFLVQDGAIYTYIPAANPAPSRRDYNPASPPSIVSTNMNETRRYRVYLPRGYDAHPTRRYPVLYMHDGQNVFESGAFGSWNAAATLENLTRDGQMREIIVVGVDNGPNRLTDYLPPGDVLSGAGRADRYARFLRDELKPLIDAQYRTIPDAAVTGVMGSSMGGVVSMYLGYDFTSTFTRVGALSGAWWTCPNFRARITPINVVRPVRIYMDSGDSGQSSDDYWNTYNLRDALVSGGAAARFTLEGSGTAALRHVVGFGQQHNEAAWSARLPGAMTFLYPANEGVNDLVRSVFTPAFDIDNDGAITLEDLYSQNRSPLDLNADGVANATDTEYLSSFLRRFETEDMSAGRR